MSRRSIILPLALLLLLRPPSPAAALDLGSMFKSKPPLTEDERKETVDKIREVQEKLRLLQDKLRALEKRKAAEAAARTGTDAAGAPVPGEINWQGIERNAASPGDFGLYTYLLFSGNPADDAALGTLEDLILTIETLPPAQEPPAIGNRFLLPVEPSQSTVILARRPYDFRLAHSFLERLGLDRLPEGPVLVSLNEPLDPYAAGMAPPFIAVALGRQEPQRQLALARTWHGYEKSPAPAPGHPLADLFWQLIDGTGPARVTRSGGKLVVDMTAAQEPGTPARP